MAEINVTTTRNRQYKDISLSFGKNPVTNDVIAVFGEEAVKRSIQNILRTHMGEVPFFPEFGSRINQLLFEPIDPMTTALLRDEILATIGGYEPRCIVQRIELTPSDDEQKYTVLLTLRLVNQLEPITLTLFLSRIR